MKNLLIVFAIISYVSGWSQTMDAGILFHDQTNNETIHQSAINYYTNLIDENPLDAENLVKRSQLYRTINKPIEAANDWNRALLINPYSYLYKSKKDRKKILDKRKYEYNLNPIYSEMNPFSKSYLLDDEYVNLLDSDKISEDKKMILTSALIAISEGELQFAEEEMAKVQDLDRFSALYHDVMGVIAIEKNEFKDAILYFDKAIEIDPDFTVAYHNRAVAKKLSGDLASSESDFKTAILQRADIAKIKFSKARLLELKGDVVGALNYYEEAIHISENYPEARLNYSIMLKAAGEYTKGLIEINKLIEEYPDNDANYYVRGGYYFIYGEYTKAVKDYDTYLATNPDDLDVLFYRGLSSLMGGNKERGCEDISESIDNGYKKHSDLYLFMCE